MKLQTNAFLPTDSLPNLARALNDQFRRTNEQVNKISEGKIEAAYQAQVSPPSQGIYAVGDFVSNQDRGVPLGVVGSQYLLWGWCCTSATDPPAWAEMRIPTGT